MGDAFSGGVTEDADVGGRGVSPFKGKHPRVAVDKYGLLCALRWKDHEGVLEVRLAVHLQVEELLLWERKTP